MRILTVTQVWFPDTIGGAGRYAYDVAQGLRSRGHELVVLAPQQPNLPMEERPADGMQIVRYAPMRRWWQLPQASREIRGAFHRLHTATPFDLIAIHQPLPGAALLRDPAARRIPWVYHFHSPWAQEAHIMHPSSWLDVLAGPRLALMHDVEGRQLRRAASVMTLSEWMRALAIKGHHLPDSQVRAVGGCADMERFRPPASREAVRARLGLPAGRLILLTVRNLVPRMNLDRLVEAMRAVTKRHPEALLLIGGSGPLRDALAAQIERGDLSGHVRMLGSIAEAQLPQWYQAADVFVMPSKALEGFGLSTLEALACGTPAVGTPVGGTKELLDQVDPSLVCAGTEAEDLSAGLQAALTRLRDPRAREALSEQCRAFAQRFNLSAVLDRIEAGYRQAARGKVLHVHTMPVMSGSGINTWLSMQGQRQEGYQVELACGNDRSAGGSLIQRVRDDGFTVYSLRHLVQPLHAVHDILAVGELWRLLQRHRYSIVHTHNSKAGFVGRLAAKLAGVPVVVHTVHGFAFHNQERWWRRRLFRALERLAAGWCDHLVVISEPLIEWAVRDRVAPRSKMTKIYSGIDLQAFQQPVDAAAVRRGLGFDDRAFVVGQVSKLWQGKGHDVLLRAAERLKDRLPELRLLLIGEGELMPGLQRMARELGLAERVVFTGFRSDIPALTQALDVAVLPSLFEGMGRAVLEAQAAGKAMIASRVGGIPDLIADGQTGLLVDPGDAAQLADAIQQLHDQPQLRRQLGEAAKRALDERFDARVMAHQIAGVYEQLRAGKREPC